MGEELNVISLNESQKKEFMKRGKELCFRSFKVWCPEGYQILRFDPNLLIDKDTAICNEPQKLDTLLIRQHGTEFCTEQDLVLLILP